MRFLNAEVQEYKIEEIFLAETWPKNLTASCEMGEN